MRMDIVLPIPLPTWNRLLAMNYWARKQARDMIHSFVRCAVSKQGISDFQIINYMEIIRPSAKNKRQKNETKNNRKKKVSCMREAQKS